MSQNFCPSCHTPYNAGDQFCGNCGTRVSPVVTQPNVQSQRHGQPHYSQPQGYAQPQAYHQPQGYNQYQGYNQPQDFGIPHGQAYSAGVASPMLAGFWIRFFANFIDGLIVFMGQWLLSKSGFETGLAGVIFSAVYFIGFWTATSTSPGKLMLGLRIEKQDGKPLEFGSALLRYLGTIISSILLGIGYLMIAFDDRKRALHDLIAKTRVVIKS